MMTTMLETGILTQGDFLQALREVSEVPPQRGRLLATLRHPVRGTWRTLARCPMAAWVRRFGEPERITVCNDASARLPLRVWEHECADGRATCIGHWFDDPADGPSVLVVRLCLA